MSHTQNIFRHILANNLVEDFAGNYTEQQLRGMYDLTKDEAKELFYFIRMGWTGADTGSAA